MPRAPSLVAALSALMLAGCPDRSSETSAGDTSSGTSSGAPVDPSSSTSSTGVSGTSGTSDAPDPTSGPSTSTAGSSSGDTTGPSCDIELELEPLHPRAMLVLDKSGSMIAAGDTDEPGEAEDGFWDHDADPATPEITRWMSLHDAIGGMVSQFDAGIDFGAVLFPSIAATSTFDEGACLIDPVPLVSTGPAGAGAIMKLLPAGDSTDIRGGTPTTAGVALALADLALADTAAAQFIVLVTDGAANCKAAEPLPGLFNLYDDELAPTVAAAEGDGIRTYVVGIDILDAVTPVVVDGQPDGINPHDELSKLAELGGTARPGEEKFYNATNQIELQDALTAIAADNFSCEIDLPFAVPGYAFLQRVEVGADDDPEQLVFTGFDEQVSDCAAETGWQYTSPARDAFFLCGAACDLYKHTGLVSAELGCAID